ncbi:hypothetical protein AGMMS49960_19140 [Betaproteobacteria bacterium]|nr:hypothetical protein AGMMS49543_13440 [Betaproteobacteria bacterium]GHU04002.1 hypothetical protein AGMMS49960_19140 [Betaproteobacteria bacterium]GHU20738.1 hypothetical protein AGMMS50243_16400 [Betaproteobacteria bacterium]
MNKKIIAIALYFPLVFAGVAWLYNWSGQSTDHLVDTLTELNHGERALRKAFVDSIKLSRQATLKSNTATNDLRKIGQLATSASAQRQQLDKTLATLEQETPLSFPRFRLIVIDGLKAAQESLEHTRDLLDTRDKLARNAIPPESARDRLDDIGWKIEESRLQQMKLLWAACDYFNDPEHDLPLRRTEFQRGLCAPITNSP